MSRSSIARKRLEQVVERQLARAWKYGLNPVNASGGHQPSPLGLILAAAERYKEAAVGETADRLCNDQLAAVRLALAAEETGGKSKKWQPARKKAS